MPKTRPLLPTITSSLGMLIGGLLGAGVGSLASHEWIVMACYIVGFVGGSICGAMIGWRWQARRNTEMNPE